MPPVVVAVAAAAAAYGASAAAVAVGVSVAVAGFIGAIASSVVSFPGPHAFGKISDLLERKRPHDDP